jgi:hypothetical protein
MSDKSSNARLRLLALPSQTTLLFIVVIGVMLAAVTASGLPGSPMRAAPPLVLILAVLTLRDFLMQPEREIRDQCLIQLPSATYPRLVKAVATMAASLQYAPAPRLMIALKTRGALFAFGSFRRSYIAFGEKVAEKIERDLQLPSARAQAEAALMHEFQHLSQGDVIVVGLARSTLKAGALFMLWSGVFLLGLVTVSFAFPAADLFQPHFIAQVEAINPQLASIMSGILTPEFAKMTKQAPAWSLAGLYVLDAHLPIFITAFALFITVWRRLLKVREIYADVATAAALGQANAIELALLRYGAVAHLQQGPNAGRDRNAVAFPLSGLMETIRNWSVRTADQLSFHPSMDVRRKGLKNPVLALSEPTWVGVTAGILVLLLDLLLIGSFTLAYTSEATGAIAVLVGFAVISLCLLPQLAANSQESEIWQKSMLIGVGWVLVIRIGFHFLNLALLWFGVLIAPQDMAAALNGAALASVGALRGGMQAIGVEDLFKLAIGSTIFAIYLTILIVVILPTILIIDWQLKRLTLTWYGLPDTQRGIVRAWWLISAAVALAAGGVWLPIVNSIVPFSPGFGFSVADIVAVAISLVLLAIGGWWWGRLHHRYSRQCPHCKGIVPGWFQLGRRCEACNAVLHEWLQARY